jgi:ABC-type enterochelin transport system permease subunit
MIRKDYLGFILGAVIIIGTLAFLVFIPVPPTNSEILKVVIGMVFGSLIPPLFTIFSKESTDVQELKKENSSLREKNELLQARVDKLEESLIHLQGQVIDKLSKLSMG